MSGIMAAKTLHDAGIKDILILEATSRIGGRMKKAEIGGGGLYPEKLVEETEEIAAARDEFCVNLSRVLNSEAGDGEDVSILAAHRLFGKIPETPLERLIDYYHNDFEDADPPQISSLRNIFPRSESADHGPLSHFVADSRGFEVVVKYLAKQFLSSLTNDPRIRLNKMWKRIAIADFSMTVYTKIFLKFPYKFWPTGPGTEFFLYTHIQRGYYPIWQVHFETKHNKFVQVDNMLMCLVLINVCSI
ncbi:Polyamine oxidase 1 [Linum perenne]